MLVVSPAMRSVAIPLLQITKNIWANSPKTAVAKTTFATIHAIKAMIFDSKSISQTRVIPKPENLSYAAQPTPVKVRISAIALRTMFSVTTKNL